MNRPKVVVLDDYQEVAGTYGAWPMLEGRVETRFITGHLTGGALLDALSEATIVVAMRERTAFPAGLLAQLPALRLLITTGMANASIDLAAAAQHGVTVCGTDSVGPPTAELTWALILGVARHIATEDAAIRAGRWQTTIGSDLAGSTLGIIGLGRLGQRVAAVARAFEMNVLAWSDNLTGETAAAAGATRAGSLRELLVGSDIVTIHTRLSDRTRGLIGAAELALMRPGSILVNTSRGPIVDNDALIAALHDGRLGGAGLDVFEQEPLPGTSPLREAPNLLLTPHLGYVTEETYRVFFDDVTADIDSWLQGTPIRLLGG